MLYKCRISTGMEKLTWIPYAPAMAYKNTWLEMKPRVLHVAAKTKMLAPTREGRNGELVSHLRFGRRQTANSHRSCPRMSPPVTRGYPGHPTGECSHLPHSRDIHQKRRFVIQPSRASLSCWECPGRCNRPVRHRNPDQVGALPGRGILPGSRHTQAGIACKGCLILPRVNPKFCVKSI